MLYLRRSFLLSLSVTVLPAGFVGVSPVSPSKQKKNRLEENSTEFPTIILTSRRSERPFVFRQSVRHLS